MPLQCSWLVQFLQTDIAPTHGSLIRANLPRENTGQRLCTNTYFVSFMLQYQRVELYVYVTRFMLALSLQFDLNNPKKHCRTLEYQMCLVNQQDAADQKTVIPSCNVYFHLSPSLLARSHRFCSSLVSLNRLSVGCGATPRRQSGYLVGFCLFIHVIFTILPPHGHWLILPYFLFFINNCKFVFLFILY